MFVYLSIYLFMYFPFCGLQIENLAWNIKSRALAIVGAAIVLGEGKRRNDFKEWHVA